MEEIRIEEQRSEENTVNKQPEKKGGVGFLFDLVSIIATSAIAVAVVFLFVFRTVGVVGRSMNPTLQWGDRIVLSAFDFEPKQGEIVVTCQPAKSEIIEDTLVKRVIATEGQTVDIDFAEGVVYVDGVALDEPYTSEPTTDREDFVGPVTVPEGYIFVMGDNRNASTDSRSNLVGMIRKEYVMGKALFRIVPFGNFKIG